MVFPSNVLRWHLSILIAPLLFLSACRVDDLKPATLSPPLPPAYNRSTGGAAPMQQASSANWWRAFKDPLLDQLLSRTAQGNLTLVQARQRLIAARALAHSEISSYSPNVGLTGLAQAGTGKSIKNDLTRRPLQLNVEMGWEVALFGEHKLKQQAADQGASMAGEDLEAARLAVTADTASAYVRLRSLQKKSENARLASKLLSRSQLLATNRARNGLDTGLQADAQTSRLRAATVEQARLDAAVADVMQQIATLEGNATPDRTLAAPRPQPQAPLFQTSNTPADLLRRRPDVRRAELAVLQAGAELGLAKADLYPKLHLSGTVGIGTPINGNILGLMGGPSLQIPLLDRGKRQDIIVARQALLEDAMAAYRQSVLLAYEEASTALGALQVARQNVVRLQNDLAAAKRAQGAADLLLREGLSDASGSVADHLTVLDKDTELAQAREDEALAQIALIKAMAGETTAVNAGPARNGG